MVENAYIHIPFCKSKCKYCSFISYPNLELKGEYLYALEKEILKNYKGELLKTLYFGGGTPSLLKICEFEKLIKLFNINEQTEITAELNPEEITFDYLSALKHRVNRISFGCQTFDDKILKLIGRRHNSQDVINAVKYAKSADFKNINLDFIYGLPYQSIEIFENDLKKAIELDIQHISLYGLKIDENCFFAKNPPNNLPNDDCQAEMYLKAIEILTQNGFEHYEISNFSKSGFNSQHNLNYWNNNSYYGFGLAAHGYQNNIRYFNTSDLKEYIQNQFHKGFNKLSNQEQLEEEIFLGFRKISGINIEQINKKFNIDFLSKYKDILIKYDKYFEKFPNSIRLTNEGILISNVILSEFLQ